MQEVSLGGELCVEGGDFLDVVGGAVRVARAAEVFEVVAETVVVGFGALELVVGVYGGGFGVGEGAFEVVEFFGVIVAAEAGAELGVFDGESG